MEKCSLAFAMVSRFACWLSLIHKKQRSQNLPTSVIGNGFAEKGRERFGRRPQRKLVSPSNWPSLCLCLSLVGLSHISCFMQIWCCQPTDGRREQPDMVKGTRERGLYPARRHWCKLLISAHINPEASHAATCDRSRRHFHIQRRRRCHFGSKLMPLSVAVSALTLPGGYEKRRGRVSDSSLLLIPPRRLSDSQCLWL